MIVQCHSCEEMACTLCDGAFQCDKCGVYYDRECTLPTETPVGELCGWCYDEWQTDGQPTDSE